MPTYDYQCDACDHKFELYQGINDEKKRKCPECGKLKLRRLLGTGAAVVFKGSGFYQTDYRSESYNKAKAADKPAESSSSSDSGKGDSGKGDSGKGDSGKGDSRKSDSGKGDSGKSASKPEPAKSESKKPEGGKSKPAKSD